MEKKFFILMLLCAALFTSCSQEEDSVYSCDKEVDAWVKANVDQVHVMTRAQWKGLSESVNRAVYRAFTPEQRIKFWQEKFAEVKRLDWSDAEINHIQKAEDFLNSHHNLFRKGRLDNDDLDELDAFFYKWAKDAEREFGWDKKVVYSIVATGNEVKDTKGNLVVRKRSLPASAKMSLAAEQGNHKDNCNCNNGSIWSCMNDAPCEDVDCDGSDNGCGLFMFFPCDGRCGGY